MRKNNEEKKNVGRFADFLPIVGWCSVERRAGPPLWRPLSQIYRNLTGFTGFYWVLLGFT